MWHCIMMRDKRGEHCCLYPQIDSVVHFQCANVAFHIVQFHSLGSGLVKCRECRKHNGTDDDVTFNIDDKIKLFNYLTNKSN